MIRTIIFDFDGVLVESNNMKTESFGKLFEHEGKKISEKVVEYHLNHAGVSRFDKFKYIYKEILHRELSENTFENLCSRFSNLVMDKVITSPYVPGAKEFLDEHYMIYDCFVVSATPQHEIEEIISQRNINHYFKKIYGSPQKKATSIGMILDTYNLKSSEVVFVGDALADYRAAQANSVFFVARLVKDGYQFQLERCPKINDLTSFDKHLDKINHILETSKSN